MPPMEEPGSPIGATAIVLAGGKSSRMGTPKALLLFDGEPLIVHVVTRLRRLFAEVVVNSRKVAAGNNRSDRIVGGGQCMQHRNGNRR